MSLSVCTDVCSSWPVAVGKNLWPFLLERAFFLKAPWPVNDCTGLKYCIFIKDFSRDALLILKPHFCMDSSFLTVTILASGVCE